ncbi:MAG: lipoate--protein ligase [Ignavibacteria bacterium]|nr:lipoate--protein ligase [Ignavibacteria bacterium]
MIFINNNSITTPAVNLAIEEYAVRNFDLNEDYVFLYSNENSVICGKNQNVFEEIDYKFCIENNIGAFRRISGGGAVFHDTGNLNFSFLTKYENKKFNKYADFVKPVIDCLKKNNIDVYLNSRNDIFSGEKKISGNAQFVTRDRMLCHGTLLVNSNLVLLRKTLNSDASKYFSKSTKSVKSSVVNISEEIKGIDVLEVKNMIREEIILTSAYFGEYFFSTEEWQDIYELAKKKYNSFEWNYGRSPDFIFENKKLIGDKSFVVKLEIFEGIIKNAQIFKNGKRDSVTEEILINKKYDLQYLTSMPILKMFPAEFPEGLKKDFIKILF